MNTTADAAWRPMTFDAFDAWVETRSDFLRENAFFNDAEHFLDEGVRFYAGDLAVGQVRVAPVTVVDGDLRTGDIDWAFDTGLLVVTGDLHIDYIGRINLDIVVGGDVIARSMCINTLNDYCLRVGGDLRCEVFVEAGCYVEVAGKIVCPRIVSIHNEVVAHGGIDGELIDIDDNARLVSILSDEVLGNNDYIDEDAFERVVRAGRSPYRDAT